MAGAAAAAAVAGDDGRRVKFLCSFGGQIIPRPSDGALRYAGGHTRIIAVRRDAPLEEIMRKMSAVLGGPVALRYQLPDVDLDALVSVSSPEDLDNMMEEYDRIAAATPDGSAKLRVFLFPPAESPDLADILAFDDCGQRYVEAVNRISSEGRISSSSGMSPEILSPNAAAAANDPSRMFFVDANPPAVSADAKPLVEFELSPYNSQPYVDLTQFQYTNPQGAPLASSPVPHQYQYAPVSQVGSEKSVPADKGRAALLQGDASLNAPYQPVSPSPASFTHNVEGYGLRQAVPVKADSYLESNLYEVSSLPAGYPQNVEGYGLRQAVPVPPQLSDCLMCQKALPHAHSDTVVQDQRGVVSDASVAFHSLRPGDAMRVAPCRVMTGPMEGENLVPLGNFASRGFAQIPEIRHENQKLVVPNAQSPDHSKATRPPAAMGLPSGTQALNGMYANIPQSGRQDSLQQQLQQPPVQSFRQPLHPVKKDGPGLGEPYGVYPVKNVNLQAPGLSNLVHAPEVPYNSQVNGKMEALHVSPFDSSLYNEERKPTANLVISNQLKPENPPLAENKLPVKSQFGGNTISIGNAFSDQSIMPERAAVRPVDQLMPSLLAFTQSQNPRPSVPSQVPTQGAFVFNHETGREPMPPTERLHPLPVYSGSVNPGHNNKNINVAANGDRKDEAIRYPNNAVGNFASPPSMKSPLPFPDSSGTTQHMELLEQPILSNSQFPTQDARIILGSTHLLPPRPTRVASKDPVISKDMVVDNLSISNQGPDLAVLLDGGVFQQPLNPLIKDSYLESPIRATRGLGEEQIDKELQAVAEKAAALVLQSPVPATHVPVARETKGTGSLSNQEARVTDDSTSSLNAAPLGDQRTETKQTDKLNPGFPSENEIGRLQIIKNSDLEELRELGSGTFGTVYHGKWRGSDVAIKRINNRCFSGKPSEQERSRVDFWNEASKLSDLHHPNVVAFYGVVVDGPGGSVATVTEYMVNGSLRQALHKNDKILDRSKRLVITMDVAFGMEYLHGKNIVHFDLKSDNLLVNLRDPLRPICKVGDLGLSKVKCQTLISGGVRGTLPWMAPELLNGSSNLVSEKVDVFSFGIVMWEILTGKEPYADMHYGAIIGGIVSNTLRPPVPESCEPDWRALMEKCWSSEPSERPSFTEIASSLRAMATPSRGR